MLKTSIPAIHPVSPISPDVIETCLPLLEKIFPPFSGEEDNKCLEFKLDLSHEQLDTLKDDRTLLVKKLYNSFQSNLKLSDNLPIHVMAGAYMRTSGFKLEALSVDYVARVVFNFNCNEIYCFNREGDSFRNGTTIFFERNTYMVTPITDRNLLVSRSPKGSAPDYSAEHQTVINRQLLRPKKYLRYTVVFDIKEPEEANPKMEGVKDAMLSTLDNVMSMKGSAKHKREKKKKAKKIQNVFKEGFGNMDISSVAPTATQCSDEEVGQILEEVDATASMSTPAHAVAPTSIQNAKEIDIVSPAQEVKQVPTQEDEVKQLLQEVNGSAIQ
jgi:hypothetical protein